MLNEVSTRTKNLKLGMDGMESLKSKIHPKNGYMQYLKAMMSLVAALRFHGQFHLGKWITVAVMTPLI